MNVLYSPFRPLACVPALLALTMMMACSDVGAAADDGGTEFDVQSLKIRGIDPAVATWFRHAPRFMPGKSTVVLTVNGSPRGKVTARFDNDGRLCADKTFQQEAGLLTPPGFSEKAACFDLRTAWPQSEIRQDPGEQRIELLVPPQAIAPAETGRNDWHHGGAAGLLNYDAQYMTSSGRSATVNFLQLYTEAGINLRDWIVRSRQNFSRFNGSDTLQHQAAYAQRTFTKIKKVLQAGQVSLSNSMFGAGQVLGFQLYPEAALQSTQGGPGLVEGIADGSSVIEVRQSGILVYSTTVPSGPYRLQGFSLLNTRTDLSVTQTGGNGETRRFVVPVSALLLNGHAPAPGLSIGAGKLEQQGTGETPLMATAATGWRLSPFATLNAGILGSSLYRAAALGLDSQPFDRTLLSLQTTAAQNARHNNHGLSVTAALNRQLSERVSVSLNTVRQTSGFREISDALQDNQADIRGRNRSQTAVGVSWADRKLGNLNISLARSETFYQRGSSYYIRSAWSRQVSRTYLSVSLEHDTGTAGRRSDNRLYASLSLPLGDAQTVSSYLSGSRNARRSGVRYSSSGQEGGWSLSSEHDLRNNRSSGTGTLNRVTPVSQLSGGVSHNSDNYTSWSTRIAGAVVAHERGVTLSPHQIGDTFGIVQVGNESGVRLNTPAGPVWTDGRGHAVLSSLGGFRRSPIQVDTRTLEKNVDIANAWQETEAARGSVSYLGFDVARTRRVLAEVQDRHGSPLPHGAGVFDAAGNLVTIADNRGRVFIPHAGPTDTLSVQLSGTTLCSFTLSLPEQSVTGGLYEETRAVCR